MYYQLPKKLNKKDDDSSYTQTESQKKGKAMANIQLTSSSQEP
jgi:hypothetical protein